MKALYGLKLKEEIHAARFISRPGPLTRIPRQDRLAILRHFADELATMTDINIINVAVNKPARVGTNFDVFEMAWKVLIQRFENTLSHRNFSGPANPDERGMLFPDHTDDKKLTRLFRQMRRWNPTPHDRGFSVMFGSGYRNLSLTTMIEDPNFRNSEHSYFIQATDLAAFLLYQYIVPNSYMRNRGGHRYFLRLDPVLCKVASRSDPYGVVYL
jgi:hypothetical protein